MEKDIQWTRHAAIRLEERGATTDEVECTLRLGDATEARGGKKSYKMNFPFDGDWAGRHYRTKQIEAIVADEPEALVVITVMVYYF